MKLSLLTCTGDRPEALALCAGYTDRLVRPTSTAWVVVDDGREATELGQERVDRWDGTYIRAVKPEPEPGESLRRNLLLGLREIVRIGGHAVIIEDDDFYSPFYLNDVFLALNAAPEADLIGFAPTCYYNVRLRRWWEETGTPTSASLAATTIRASALPEAIRIIERAQAPFFDRALWTLMKGRLFPNEPTRLVVGIKGMPGRKGLGGGHRRAFFDGMPHDPELAKLREWIGVDADRYARFYSMP